MRGTIPPKPARRNEAGITVPIMRNRNILARSAFGRMAAAVLGSLTLVVALAGPASATPGHGVTGRTISQKTAGGTDYILREITVAPGGATGWHYHDGTLYALVTKGTFTHNASDCSVDGLYEAGDKILEPAGSGNVHIGRNLGTTPVVLRVLYVLPHGSPLSRDAANPGCPFQ